MEEAARQNRDFEAEIDRLERRFAPHAGHPHMEEIRRRARAWHEARVPVEERRQEE